MATNDITSLIKFCGTETALKILNSQSLRWSSPHLFNDPFELDHNSRPDFTNQSLVTGIIREAIGMLFGPTEPTGKKNRLIAAISRWREEDRFASEEEAEVVLKQLLTQVAQQQQQTIDEYLLSWKTFASKTRICCLSDKPTNIHAWQRFGDNHNGIAMRFKCGEDSALPDPLRVNYGTTPPLVTSLKEQIKVCYGYQDTPSADEFSGKMLCKNKENNTEKEWRCIEKDESNNETDEQLWYSNKKFSTPELKAVYLGLATNAQDKKSIIALIKQKYNTTKVYQAEVHPGRFELDFSQI